MRYYAYNPNGHPESNLPVITVICFEICENNWGYKHIAPNDVVLTSQSISSSPEYVLNDSGAVGDYHEHRKTLKKHYPDGYRIDFKNLSDDEQQRQYDTGRDTGNGRLYA